MHTILVFLELLIIFCLFFRLFFANRYLNLFFGNYVKFVSALGALDLVSTLFARETEGTGAFGAIAEDVSIVVLILSLTACRGVEGDDPLQLAYGIKKESVLAAALVDLLGHCAECGEGKYTHESHPKADADYGFRRAVADSKGHYYVCRNNHQ